MQMHVGMYLYVPTVSSNLIKTMKDYIAVYYFPETKYRLYTSIPQI